MKILKTLNLYTKLCDDERKNIPVQLNLVHEINPNENAHSRILAQLLRVSESNLKSLLNYLGGSFKEINVANSTVYCEKERIDISVITKSGDAIIIENKIRDAVDQPRQIERYINCIKELGIAESRIFVLYLTNKGGHPSEDSLSTGVAKQLNDKYLEINYRDHILPWLKNKLLPGCQYRDKVLISAVEQYVNFLEIRFHKQDVYKEMNKKIEKLLISEFELQEKEVFDRLEIINQKKTSINELADSIEIMQRNCLVEIFDVWKSQIPNIDKYTFRSNYKEFKEKSYFFLSLIFVYHGVEFACGIGKDYIEDNVYYTGVSVRGTKEETKSEQIIQLCKELYPNEKSSGRWYVWKQCDYVQVMESFKEIVKRVEENL